jgi:Flp pilus assembly protein TadG
MKLPRRNFLAQQQGQSLVEFALLLPILVVIVFGTVELGRLWMTMNVLTGAAREGARVAAVTAPNVALVQSAANNVLAAVNITGATVTVVGPNASNTVIVTVRLNYTVLTGAIVPGLNRTLQLSRSTSMRWEG